MRVHWRCRYLSLEFPWWSVVDLVCGKHCRCHLKNHETWDSQRSQTWTVGRVQTSWVAPLQSWRFLVLFKLCCLHRVLIQCLCLSKIFWPSPHYKVPAGSKAHPDGYILANTALFKSTPYWYGKLILLKTWPLSSIILCFKKSLHHME